jgi:hypothetical protein
MKDLKDHLEKLRTEANDCALIGRLATDPKKRELFARLALHLSHMADEIERALKDADKDQTSRRDTIWTHNMITRDDHELIDRIEHESAIAEADAQHRARIEHGREEAQRQKQRRARWR